MLASNVIKKIQEFGLTRSLKKHSSLTIVFQIIVVIFWSFPSYDVAILTDEMKSNWDAIFIQVEAPFTNHNDLYGYGSHSEKLAFRFVPILILKVLGINTLIPALVFQFFTMIIFYVATTITFNKLFQDKFKVLLYTIPICLVVAGHVYCSDYRGIFDTVALAFLVTSLMLRDKPYTIIFLILAYFTDERALIASPSIILIDLFLKEEYNNLKSITNGIKEGAVKYVLFSWATYFAIRYFLSFSFGLATGTGGINLFFSQLNRTFYTFYIGLEGFIIPLIMLIVFLIRKRNFIYLTLMMAAYFSLFFVAQSVIDINRSMSYNILFIILIITAFDRLFNKEKVYPIMFTVLIINAVYDDFYPLILQIYRMIFITQIF